MESYSLSFKTARKKKKREEGRSELEKLSQQSKRERERK